VQTIETLAYNATEHAPKAAEAAPPMATAPAAETKPAAQKKPGFFTKVGRFFKRLFGAERG
jgi:hypothetical protein